MKEAYLRYMKFLIKELHKEWGCSGTERKSVAVTLDEVKELKKIITESIAIQQEIIDSNSDLEFMESMKMSKDNFVMLRIMKKLEKKIKKGGNTFIIELDNEEFKKYTHLLEPEEGD